MSPALWIVLGIVLLLLCVSAFFSGSETSITAVSRARMLGHEKNGDARATRVGQLIETKDRVIGALLIGNNLVNILASALATSAFLGLFGEAGVVYATLAMTLLVVVFGEVLPKTLAISNPDGVALRLAGAIGVIVRLLSPLTGLVNAIVRAILKLFGVSHERGAVVLTAHDELRGAMEALHRDGALVGADRSRLGGLLDLAELEISDVMVHRTGMRLLNADEPPEELVRQVLESPYTRMPVFRGALDNIVGVLHAKDVLRALSEVGNDVARISIPKLCAKPWFVPETTTLQDQLNAFLRRKSHFALVVDEYGEVQGLITLEDIIEEIVGNIDDEHDIEMQGVLTEADGSVIVDGSVPIRDLNRALDWNLPDDEAVTIAGLVIHETQTIPEERQAFTFFQKRFTVMKREKNRITRLRIRPAEVVVPPKKGASPTSETSISRPPHADHAVLDSSLAAEADAFGTAAPEADALATDGPGEDGALEDGLGADGPPARPSGPAASNAGPPVDAAPWPAATATDADDAADAAEPDPQRPPYVVGLPTG